MQCPSRTTRRQRVGCRLRRDGRWILRPRPDFRRHLVSCDVCREMVAAQEAVWSALDEWRHPSGSRPASTRSSCTESHRRKRERRMAQLVASFLHKLVLAAGLIGGCSVCCSGDCVSVKNADQAVKPAPRESQASPRIEQQVEHALDDMDMLRSLVSKRLCVAAIIDQVSEPMRRRRIPFSRLGR